METKPPVRRRIVVPEDTTPYRLHEVLQAAFGWWDCHRHEFEIGGERYGSDDGEDWEPPEDERRAPLRNLVVEGSSFFYVFSDYWRHKVVVERLPGRARRSVPGLHRRPPRLSTRGLRRPAWGYLDFLEAIKTRTTRSTNRCSSGWGGQFDPAAVDPTVCRGVPCCIFRVEDCR